LSSGRFIVASLKGEKQMFGNQKIQPPKAKKRHSLAWHVIGLFTLAVEGMLGINAAFLVHQSVVIVADNMLMGTFLAPLALIITLIISLSVGFCFIAAGVWMFSGFMNSLDDARAYSKHFGAKRWPVMMVWSFALAVLALDFTTLAFRASYFAEKGAIALFVFFVILIFMPFILGLLMHVLENTPRDRRLAKAKYVAQAIEMDDVTNAVQEMDDDVRRMWLNGDTEEALQEHKRRIEARLQEQIDYEEAQRAEQEEKEMQKHLPPQKQAPFLKAVPDQ
jgi:signal transduction histidine kinase